MMMNMKITTVMPVVDSWDLVKKDDEWQKNFGTLLFQRILKASPLSLTLILPFATDGEKILDSNTQFESLVTETASVIDFIVSCLGADMELLQMQLTEIFESHENFSRIRPEHWVIMGKALLSTLEETLGDRFDQDMAGCWASVFDAVSTMIVEDIASQG